MLSRLALAQLQAQSSRLAPRATRVAPLLSPRSAVAAPFITPFLRTYASKNKGNQKPSPKDAAREPSPSDPANKSAAKGAADSNAAASEAPKSTESEKSAEEIPFDKLPDLTQGIPSTLFDELEKAQGKSQGKDSSLQTVPQYERQGRGGGNSEYVSTSERNRRWWARFMLTMGGGGAVLGIFYLGRNWDDELEAKKHPEIPDGLTPSLWWQRVKARMGESVSYYQDPAFDKLLPDPHPSFERPYTLVISLEDLLVHSEWSRQHGWRLAKRPGVDYFIRYLGQYYELVVWSSTSFGLAEGIVRKLDPFRFIMWPLFREATKFEDGEIVKVIIPLSKCLNLGLFAKIHCRTYLT